MVAAVAAVAAFVTVEDRPADTHDGLFRLAMDAGLGFGRVHAVHHDEVHDSGQETLVYCIDW